MVTTSLHKGMLASDALRDVVALVTGGGTGLGKAIAVELARAGAVVVIGSRNAEHRAAGVAAVEAAGGQAVEVELDVRDPRQVTHAFDEAERLAGPVTILVNNAAANFYAAAETITPNGWSTVVDRVLTGGFQCAAEFARRRLAVGDGGSIVNVAANTGWDGGPGVAHSAAAKAGLLNLTRTLAVEWARDGITVNAVVPGLFLHDDDDDTVRAGRRGFAADAGLTIPAGRTGDPRELAWLVTYLCSPWARYVTGQWIAIDGGRRLPMVVDRADFTPIRDQLERRGRTDRT